MSCLEKIFSVKNEKNNARKHKVITILWLKFKFCIKPTAIDKIRIKLSQAIELSVLEKRKYLKFQFYEKLGYKLNLDNPRTFNEKLQWLKLNYRNPLLTICSDKVAVRDFVRDKIGEEYLVPCIGIYDSPDEIDFNTLPNQFVMKVNWGSGQNIIVKNKDELDIEKAKSQLKNWIMPQNNLYFYGLEWCYKNIQPKIIVEKYLETLNQSALDYKFLCFGGKPHFIWVTNRYKDISERSFYNLNWEMQELELVAPNKIKPATPVAKPKNLEKMIELVTILCKDFPHVRVDLYRLDDNTIKFGELTFYSDCGYGLWRPIGTDRLLGDLLELPKIETKD